jgi:hypothetical protein
MNTLYYSTTVPAVLVRLFIVVQINTTRRRVEDCNINTIINVEISPQHSTLQRVKEWTAKSGIISKNLVLKKKGGKHVYENPQ